MGNKAFLVLIAIAILLGASLGGAFAAGVAVGRSQDNSQAANGTSTDIPAFTPPSAPAFAPPGAQGGLQEITPQQLEQFRQQIGQQFGEGGGFPFGGGGLASRALTGDIESIDGNVITVNTPQGPLQATLSEDTGIQVFSQGTPQDLEIGQQVIIGGERNEEGVMEATDVLVTPEGDLFGGGFLGAGGARRLP